MSIVNLAKHNFVGLHFKSLTFLMRNVAINCLNNKLGHYKLYPKRTRDVWLNYGSWVAGFKLFESGINSD